MNKFLLTSLAFALACGPASAQFQIKQIDPVVKKSSTYPKSNLTVKGNIDKFKRATRADELKVPLNAKTLSNMPGWERTVFPVQVGAEANLTFKVATFYDPVLLSRFDGNTIKKINTLIGPNCKNFHAFIINALTGETLWEGETLDRKFNTTLEGKEIKFDCDYKIDKTVPILVGYQLTAKSSAVELALVDNFVSEGCLIDIVGDEQGFGNLAFNDGTPCVAYIDCETEGEAGLKENDVVVLDVVGGRIPVDSEYNTVATFINYGTNPVSSIETSYIVNDVESKGEVPTGDKPFPFMAPGQLTIKATSPSDAARYFQKFLISKVNSVDDEYTEANVFTGKPDNLTQNVLTAISETYPRKVVMEQFTGTWCGWCPRGHVAMKKAEEAFPNDFIGIAVHAGDELATEDYNSLLGSVGSFPSAMLNRVGYSLMDPYYGMQGPAQKEGEQSGDILNDIAAVNKFLTEAKIGLSSKLDGSNVEVTSVMNFTLPADGRLYSVAYVLLEDGLRGLQTNYYHKSKGAFKSADQIPEEDLRFLFDEGSRDKYLAKFNNVAVAAKDVLGLEGSLDDVQIKAGVPVSHQYTIPIPATVKHTDKLKVVALLIDNISGEIVNAAKVNLGEATTGVETVAVESAEISVVPGAMNVKGNGVVSLYNVDGKLVKQESVNGSATISTVGLKGTYVVRVVDGNNLTVKKVLL